MFFSCLLFSLFVCTVVLFGTFWVKKDVYITVTEWRAVGTEGEWNFLLQSQVEEQRSNVDCRLENWQRFCEM